MPRARLSWLVKLYENLTYVRMRPAAIALNYSLKDIRNDVRQIIYTHIHVCMKNRNSSVGLAHARPNKFLVSSDLNTMDLFA